MRESLWNRQLNSKLKTHLRIVWKIQAESQNGVVDNYYLGDFRDLWMEAKMIDTLPKRDSTIIVPDCTTLQLKCLQTHYDFNCDTALVMVAVKKVKGFQGAIAIPFIHEEWIEGITTADAKERLMTYAECVAFITETCNNDVPIGAAMLRNVVLSENSK